MSLLRPLCPGTIASLANHSSTIIEPQIPNKFWRQSAVFNNHIGLIYTKHGQGRIVGYVHNIVWDTFRFCELSEESCDRIFDNSEVFGGSRYIEISDEVNGNPKSFVLKKADAFKERLLEHDRASIDA